jgi:hypothetical protein
MTEFESAIIIVLILLVLFSLWSVYSSRNWACASNDMRDVEWFAGNDRTEMPLDKELNLLANGGYQELLNTTAVDTSTKASHKEYVSESLGKVNGASKATVLDHDLDVNWYKIRPKSITPSNDALQQYSANDSDYTVGMNIKW